jgi:MFS family permease
MLSQLTNIAWVQTAMRHVRKVADIMPAVFFVAGFVWDALTIGRNVAALDLWIFAGYLFCAAVILYLIGRPIPLENSESKLVSVFKKHYSPRLPYFLLQFLFGSLFSALFILYFKSSSHWLAWLMSLALAVLLVANEFLESEYKRFTLSWSMFGLCAMLLFNFALPFILGSIHAIWFYLSTLLGASLAFWLYKKTPNHLGSIKPVAAIAALLMLAYAVDMIPPVPLVKRDVVVAFELEKTNGQYRLSQQASPWWVFWRKTSNDLEMAAGQRVYCFSSIFAPPGLQAKLYHRWQHYDKKLGWVTQSRIGFDLSGGRYQGFRGYTYKSNLAPGEWRVSVETENEKTITVHKFSVQQVETAPQRVVLLY